MSGTQLNATASALFNGVPTAVPGTFQYTPAAGTKLSVGQNQTLNLLFSPTDSLNYVTAVGSVSINVLAAAVSNRQAFYNNSKFDGNSGAGDVADDAAIAADKRALLPGQTATFANYTSFSQGINGIVIDVLGLPAGGANLTAADFTFKVGNDSLRPIRQRVGLSRARRRQVSCFDQALTAPMRIDLTWADGAIVNSWLQVVFGKRAHTRTAANDTFYIGNAIGESGDSSTNANVDSADETAAHNNPHLFLHPAAIGDPTDFNRDGLVNATDILLMREAMQTTIRSR